MSVFSITNRDSCMDFLQRESTIKVILCVSKGCGWCTKFEPVFKQVAPPLDYITISPDFPLFAIIQAELLESLNSEWIPEAIAMGVVPKGFEFVKGGNPKFVILSGTNHPFAEKNKIVGTKVGYCEDKTFLGTLELAMPGVLTSTQTFEYVGTQLQNQGMAEYQMLVDRRDMLQRQSGGGGAAAGAAHNCNNPDCPAHGTKNKTATQTQSQPHAGCNDPKCPMHGTQSQAKTGKTAGTQLVESIFRWNRKMLNSGKKTAPPAVTSTLIPSVQSVKRAGKTFTSTYHDEDGIQTYWTHRYPVTAGDTKESEMTIAVNKIVKKMKEQHDVPWITLPDPSISSVQLCMESRSRNAGGAIHEYEPLVYQGIQAYNWGSRYLTSLDVLSSKSKQRVDVPDEPVVTIKLNSKKKLWADES